MDDEIKTDSDMEDLEKDLEGDESFPMMAPPNLETVGEYKESRIYCCCLSPKVIILIVGIILIIDWSVEVIFSDDIKENEYYDPIYFWVYMGILGLYAIAVFFYIAYFASYDGPCSRSIVPWALLIAGIANIGLVIWVFVYIYILYKHPKVYVVSGSHEGKDKETTYDYEEWSKEKYVTLHIIEPLFIACLTLCLLCFVWDWVNRHKK